MTPKARANQSEPPRRIACGLLIALLVAGCGKKEPPRLAVFPVSGRVLVKGKPAVNAEVTLYPAVPLPDPGKRTIVPYGRVREDGTFVIGTYLNDDGAPPGEYAVGVIWPEVRVEGGEEVKGRDKLGGRYRSGEQPVTKFSVKEGDNMIPPIEL